MLLGEPARTGYDLNFQLMRIPVRVHPLFWAVAVFLGLNSTGNDLGLIVLWVLAVFVSIVIHELGHALCFRYYRISSHVVLYHFGGLAIPDSMQGAMGSGNRSNSRQQLAISAAGPAAQLGLALVVILLLRLGGYTDGFVSQEVINGKNVGGYLPPSWTADPVEEVSFIWSTIHRESEIPAAKRIEALPEKYQRRLQVADRDGDQKISYGQLRATVELPSPPLKQFIRNLLAVSIFWALLNLVPVYPLDGGQIARELFLLGGSGQAIQHSLILSIAAAAGIAFWGFSSDPPQTYMALMFLMLAYSSYTTLQQYSGRGGFGGRRPW